MHYSLISEIRITETPQPQFLFISTVYHTFIQYQSPLATQTTLFPPLGRPPTQSGLNSSSINAKEPPCVLSKLSLGQFLGPTQGALKPHSSP